MALCRLSRWPTGSARPRRLEGVSTLRARSRACCLALGSLALALALVAADLAGPSTAAAGTYAAWYCFDQEDKAVVGAERDWTGSSAGLGYQPFPVVNCPGEPGLPSGGIIAEVKANPGNSTAPVTQQASMLAPTGVTLRHLTLWWEGIAVNGGQITAIAGGSPEQILAQYRDTEFPPNRLTAPITPVDYDLPINTASLVLRAECMLGATTCQSNVLASLSVHKARVTAVDESPPQGSATGALVNNPVLTGTSPITVDAEDKGAGLYLLRILVDGRVQSNTPFAKWPCSELGRSGSGTFEFSSVIPCPLKKILTAQLDTRSLADDGFHRLQVQVIDAAGNTTIVADRTAGIAKPAPQGFFDPATRRFLNPLLNLALPRHVNGHGGGPGASLRIYLPITHSARIRHGKRKGQRRRVTRGELRRIVQFRSRPTLRGVLSDAAGRPIAGATVWIASRPEGQEWRITGEPIVTSRGGRIGLRLPARAPSRRLTLVYFPFSDTHDQAVGGPVDVKVRAGVTLSTSRQRLHNGERLYFEGHVAGPLAPRGLTVSLQVMLGRHYRTFRAVRVTPSGHGRFRTAYRFTSTTRSTRYRFRALVSRQAGTPYERGVSPSLTVLVTP